MLLPFWNSRKQKREIGQSEILRERERVEERERVAENEKKGKRGKRDFF